MPVFAAFWSYFCLSKAFAFPRTLRRAEHQNLALSIFTYFFGELILVKLSVFPGREFELQQNIE